jgi:ribose transport system permease protein
METGHLSGGGGRAAGHKGKAVGSGIARHVGRYALVVLVLILAAVFCVTEPDIFATSGNLKAMLSSESVVLILALAVTIPLRAGDFDLSIAAVMVFASTLTPKLVNDAGVPLILAVLITILFGVGIGLLNGGLVVSLDLNAFVVTLGTMTLVGGFTVWLTDGNLVSDVPSQLTDFARHSFLGLPTAVWAGWLLALILWYVYEFTPVGRFLLFVGGSHDASRLAGVSVGRVRVGAFVASGILSAVAGMILAGKLGVADPTVAGGYLLPPYAAAFLGMAAVQVGRFNVGGTIIAVYLLMVATTGLLLGGAAPWVTEVFIGTALLSAITFSELIRRRTNRDSE